MGDKGRCIWENGPFSQEKPSNKSPSFLLSLLVPYPRLSIFRGTEVLLTLVVMWDENGISKWDLLFGVDAFLGHEVFYMCFFFLGILI